MTLLREALTELDRAGVEHCVHHDAHLVDRPVFGEDIDIVVDPNARIDEPLAARGFHRFRALGCPDHRFYLGFEEGKFLKIDVLDGSPEGESVRKILAHRVSVDGLWVAMPLHPAAQAPYRRHHRRGATSPSARVLRRLPSGILRSGVVVAFVGPDGAGKSSTIERLRAEIPVATSAIYFGIRQTAPGEARSERTNKPGAIRETAFVVKRALATYRRLARAYFDAWRGHIVLCDRHPSEALAARSRHTRTAAFAERILFGLLVPRPDAVIVLDAPERLLFDRKHEHSVPALARMRKRYADFFGPRGAHVISSDRPDEETLSACSRVIWRALSDRRGWSSDD